ncbi:AfsR/SARP family transcriptional regulator [Senegalimassilia anaerobia]|uniref:AfsR/SARP family transcriptional regulator n=1 Tax=Senegalimassilia anaerobia TaxID=1473216 RepID=UPI003A97F4F7
MRAYPRPALVAKLLRERNVARFMVAPSGFGKSTLALEYAETVFAFDHVFWIDCASPCFLRDLDARGIVDGLVEVDDQSFLAVFEDVPPLDSLRAELFGAVLDDLLDRGCEVLITCTPAADVFADQIDRMLVGAGDLLLSDEEVDFARLPSDIAEISAHDVARCRRVAALAWGESDSPAFLELAASEELPADVMAALFALLCLGSGSLSDARRIVRIDDEVAELLERSYVYVGVDRVRGTFCAAPFGVPQIAQAFSDRLANLGASAHEDAGAFVLRLAEALMDAGRCARACEVMRCLASAHVRCTWLASQSRRLRDAACLLNARTLYVSLDSRQLDAQQHLEGAELAEGALLCAAKLLDDAGGSEGLLAVQLAERVAAAVARDVSRAFAATGSLTLAQALAACSFSRVLERGYLDMPGLDPRCAMAANRLERALSMQRMECERARARKLRSRASFESTHPDAFRKVAWGTAMPAMPAPPRLTVNLFGRLEVKVGDVAVESGHLSRQKVRSLLALLVLNRGRDVSRDRLAAQLWPESSASCRRKNFYATWSQLRSALSTPDGDCPYLIRHQNGVCIEARLLASDVLELEEVCRALLFNRPGRGGWGHLFARVEDSFADELLPGDDGCDVIDGLREDCKNRLVDALVAASGKLLDSGDPREGLWFARAALSRDDSREDVYVALMRAQIASLQRTAALQTYFACRRYLADDLGIDPSAETMRLYRSIIEVEERV